MNPHQKQQAVHRQLIRIIRQISPNGTTGKVSLVYPTIQTVGGFARLVRMSLRAVGSGIRAAS